MSRVRSFLIYWLPPLAWMVLIFSGSGDARSYQHSAGLVEPFLRWLFPHMSQAHIESLHYLIRKCAHLTEYAVLALLLWRALRNSAALRPRPVAAKSDRPGEDGLVAPKRSERGWDWTEARMAVLIVMLYAATDEFHQMFVPTREAAVHDVLIDTVGGLVGIILLWMFGQWRKRW